MLAGSGRAAIDHLVLAVDPQTRIPCPGDAIGEIWVQGPSVAQGYFQDPIQTRETFAAQLADDRGPFLRTGDLGFIRDGEIYITGRLKDLIVIRGNNYYPNDIELSAETCHPGLTPNASAAFSIDVGDEERLVIACEVNRAAFHRLKGTPAEAQGPDSVSSAFSLELGAAVREVVSEKHELKIHEVVFLRPNGLPRTSSGKIQRRNCREQYLQNTLSMVGVSRLT